MSKRKASQTRAPRLQSDAAFHNIQPTHRGCTAHSADHSDPEFVLELQRCASKLGESLWGGLSERAIAFQTMRAIIGSRDTCTSLFLENITQNFTKLCLYIFIIWPQGSEIHAEKDQGCWLCFRGIFLSFISLLPESYCPEVILVLLVSELLAEGMQAQMNPAITSYE